MTRSLPPLRLSETPLVHVLAQVRFPTIPHLEEGSEAVQAVLRAGGYPRVARSVAQHIHIDVGSPPRVEQLPRWSFFDVKRRTSVLLASDFVSLHTNRYESFEGFIDGLFPVLEAVGAAFDIPLFDRL